MAAEPFRRCTFQELIDDGVLEIGDGYRAKNEELGGSGPMFLRAGHVTDTHIDFEGVERFHAALADKVQPKMARAGDTIITTKGNSTGRTSFVTERMPSFVYSPHLSYWRSRDSKQLANGFLRYWSRSSEFVKQLSGMKASTDMAPYLSLTDQRRLKITLPPADEQQAIACILGSLDDKIELNRRMNQTLEALARAIFKSWFVDFDPVRAKAAGRQPPALAAHIADLFPDSFEDSELGEIPIRWEPTSVDAIATVGSGKRPSGRSDELTAECSIPLYGGGGRMGYVPTPLYEKPILFTGRVGTLGLIFRVTTPSWPSDNTLVIEPHDGFFDFAYFVLPRFDLVNLNRGSTQPLLTQTDLKRQQFVRPPDGLVKAFADVASAIFAQMDANGRQSESLAALRDALLPKLISGELRVPDAERIAERATA